MKNNIHKAFKVLLLCGMSILLSSCFDKIGSPKYYYTKPNLEWGINFDDFTKEMESQGFVLNSKTDDGYTTLYYEGKDIERYISYSFKNNNLVSAVVFIETSLIEYDNAVKSFKGYEETIVEGRSTYINASEDILGVISNITIDGTEYYAIGWSKINVPTANAVDLGLSVMWADVNINLTYPDYAAPSPEYDGGKKGLYMWGEPTGSGTNNYDISLEEISGTQYDIAAQQWGELWRIPTADETYELMNKCNWKWKNINGMDGYVITGVNGNSIFMPVTGYKNNNNWYETIKGYYWTGSTRNEYYPFALIFGNNFYTHNYSPDGGLAYPMKSTGLAIRPVCDYE